MKTATGTHQRPVAIVTGASSGIGLEVARRLASSGYAVCITARRADALSEATRALTTGGADIIAIDGAAEAPEHQQAVVDAVLGRWGRIDVLVNNAGTSPFLGDLLDADKEHLDRAWAVNVRAAWSWSKLVCTAFMSRFGGAIVNVASVGGTYPVRRVGVYNVTKAALIHMTRQLALELAPAIRVNAVASATIKTRFARAKYEGREEDVAAQYPLRRLGSAEEVATVVVMLCDGTLAWMTGQTIVIDGGASLLQGVV